MQVWIRKSCIPAADIPNGYSDACMVCIIPDKCIDCGHIHTIYNNMIGSKDSETAFDKICKHYKTYGQIWAARVKLTGSSIVFGSGVVAEISSTRNTDPTRDGMKCGGACGMWNPMAIANRDDGSFVCYSCRIGF